jgi:hypothetical protein
MKLSTRTELWHLFVGVVAGLLIAIAVIGVGGRALLGNVLILVFVVGPSLFLLLSLVNFARDDLAKQKDREYALAEELRQIRWRYKLPNHAATDKTTGLAWTGYRRRRKDSVHAK